MNKSNVVWHHYFHVLRKLNTTCFFLLCFLLVANSSYSQTVRESLSISPVTAGVVSTLTFSVLSPSSSCVDIQVKSAILKISLNAKNTTDGTFDYGTDLGGTNQTTFSYTVKLDIKGKNTPGATQVNYQRTLTINNLNPEQVVEIPIPNSSVTKFDITPVTITGSGSFTPRIDVDYKRELITEYDDNTTLPSGLSASAFHNEVTFSWTGCYIAPFYEIQVLRLFDTYPSGCGSGSINTQVIDWNDALSVILTTPEEIIVDGSHPLSSYFAKQVKLYLTEGTGLYGWRVRPIGNKFESGIANDLNYGKWSTHTNIAQGSSNCVGATTYILNYTQFDEDKNWIYSRTFTEGNALSNVEVGISNKISYANSLLQSKQNQAILNSNTNGKLLVSQTVHDYSGRPALNTLVAPVETDPYLHFIEGFIHGASPSVPYGPADFDNNATLKEPEKINSGDPLFEYYSNSNTADLYVPDAEGYPYTRNIFSKDGLNKPVESSGVGAAHKISDTSPRTTRTSYAAVADAELVRIFGDEAPDPATVQKVLTVDANNTCSVSYISKEGTTLATCLSYTANPNLHSLATGPFTVVKQISPPSVPFGSCGVTSSVPLSFTQETTVTFDYSLTPGVFDETCIAGFCRTCDYKVTFLIHDINAPIDSDPFFEVSHDVSMADCGEGVPADPTITVPSALLPAGDYIIERRIESCQSDPAGIPYIETAVADLKEDINNAMETNPFLNYIYDPANSGPGESVNDIYDHLLAEYIAGTTPGIDLERIEIDDSGTEVIDSTFIISVGTGSESCGEIRIPVSRCPVNTCDEVNPGQDFVDYFNNYWGTGPNIYVYDETDPLAVNSPNNVRTFVFSYDGTNKREGVNLVTVINNMLSGSYECEDLWVCWKGLVANYHNLVQLQFQAANDGDPQTNYTVDLFGAFLNCTGYHLEGFTTIAGNTSLSQEGYLTHPFKYFKYAKGGSQVCEKSFYCESNTGTCDVWTGISAFCQVPASSGYYVLSNWDITSSDLIPCASSNPGIPLYFDGYLNTPPGTMPTDEELHLSFFNCLKGNSVTPPTGGMNPADIISIANKMTDECEKQCESKRDAFEDVLIQAYHDKGLYVEGDDLTCDLVEDPYCAGFPNCPLVLGPPLTGSYDNTGTNYQVPSIPSSEIYCVVNNLVNTCKSKCQITVQYDHPTDPNIITSVGTPAEIASYQEAIAGTIKIEIPDDPATTTCEDDLNFEPVGPGYQDNIATLVNSLNNELAQVAANAPIDGTLWDYTPIIEQVMGTLPACSLDLYPIMVFPEFTQSFSSTAAWVSGKKKYDTTPVPASPATQRISYQHEYPENVRSGETFTVTTNLFFADVFTSGTLTISDVLDADFDFASPFSGTGPVVFSHDFSSESKGPGDFITFTRTVTAPTLGAMVNSQSYTPFYESDLTYTDGGTVYMVELDSDIDVLKCGKITYEASGFLPEEDDDGDTGGGTDEGGPSSTRGFMIVDTTFISGTNNFNTTLRYDTLTYNELADIIRSYPGSIRYIDSLTVLSGNPAVDSIFPRSLQYIIDQDSILRNGLLYGFDPETGAMFSGRGKCLVYIFLELCFDVCDEPTATCNNVCVDWVINPEVTDEVLQMDYFTCDEQALPALIYNIESQKAKIIEDRLAALREKYKVICTMPQNITDEFNASYQLEYYQYTLYYYDRAGNLIRTIAPEGVEFVATRGDHPEHQFVTRYSYNSLGQLVKQTMTDHFNGNDSTLFFYDSKGNLRFSQSPEQRSRSAFSYTKYDKLNRIVEVGESLSPFTPVTTTTTAKLDQQLRRDANTDLPVFPHSDWGYIQSQQTFTVYTSPHYNSKYIPDIFYFGGKGQRFLQNRVSYTYTDYDGNAATTDDQNYTYYSYDPHGNVEWMIQDIPGLGKSYIGYEYDVISNKVLKVKYNELRADRFFHRYIYDSDNRITAVETSYDNRNWERDGKYSYYQHGPLKRMEIGKDKVQGVDYTYTIHGWLKGINHTSRALSDDPSKDGLTATANANVARDAFGSILQYYTEDYTRSNNFESETGNSWFLEPGTAYDNLYNGNISAWTFSNAFHDDSEVNFGLQHAAFAYEYDDLNRINSSVFYNYSSGWIKPADYKFKETFTYDKNGNIKTLFRNGSHAGSSYFGMDNLTYNYISFGSGAVKTNQLGRVDDVVSPTTWTMDIDNQVSTTNYEYDYNGNLTSDASEGIGPIDWTVSGKIKQIEKTVGGNTTHIIYSYNSNGDRISKFVEGLTPATDETTYYVRDAQGNIMSVYEKTGTDDLKLSEQPIYGSSRLGINKKEISLGDFAKRTAGGYTDARPMELSMLTDDNVTYSDTIFDIPLVTTTTLKTRDSVALYAADTATAFTMISGKGSCSLHDADGEKIISVTTARQYNGTKNVCLVTNKDGYLLKGSNGIKSNSNAQSMLMPFPDNPQRFYLFTLGPDTLPYYHLLDVEEGVISKNNLIDDDSLRYGLTMAIKQDENETGTLYLRSHIDTVGNLVSFNITGDGVSGKKVLAGFTSDDASGIGEMRLTNQGTQIAIANNMGNRLPLTGIFTQSPEILIFDYSESTDSILTDTVMYHIDDSLTYPYDTAVYVVLTTEEFALDTNIHLGRTGTALRSLEFADNSRYVYFTRSNIRGGMIGYTIADSTYVNDSLTNTGGNIRRGEDGAMYAGLRNGMRTISNASSLTPLIDFEDFGLASVNYNMFGTGSSPQLLKTGPISVVQKGIYTRTLNQKYYELSDHLGNVRAVVKDYKEKKSGNLWPSPVSYADYYAFGMMLPSRNANPGDYRFGFNGQERSDEIKGLGNSNTATFWEYDTRLGRRWNIDPVVRAWESPYACFHNNPIYFRDPKGDDPPDGVTNNVTSVTKNKDNSYTINETTTIVQTVRKRELSSKEGDITYSVSETVKRITTINSVSQIDSKGNITSTNSTIYEYEGNYVSEITAMNNKTGRSEKRSGGKFGGAGEEQLIGRGTSSTFIPPFAATAASSLKSGSFPIIDDADYYIRLEFGAINDGSLAPIFKALETEEERFYQTVRKTDIILRYANQYYESMGVKLKEDRFKYDYYQLYQKNQNRVMNNPDAYDYTKSPTPLKN